MKKRYILYQSFFDNTITEDNIPDDVDDIKTVSQENFRVLLDLCFQYADVFSLTDYPPEHKGIKNYIDALIPFQVDSLFPNEWFYEHAIGEPFHVRIYSATEKAKEILLETVEDLFLTPKNGKAVFVNDLCFFRNGKAFLGTVTHEYYCLVYCPDYKFERKLKSTGRWIEVTDPWSEPFQFTAK